MLVSIEVLVQGFGGGGGMWVGGGKGDKVLVGGREERRLGYGLCESGLSLPCLALTCLVCLVEVKSSLV